MNSFYVPFRLTKAITQVLIFSILLFLPAMQSLAQGGDDNARWVTDSFEITMRNGKSSKQAIIRVLPSGTRLNIIEQDDEAGYSLVRTQGGTEGWVLSRYLLTKPPARVVMPELEARLRNSEAKRRELEDKLQSITRERDEARRQLSTAQNSGQGLEQELDDLRRLSANAIQIDTQNKSLRKTLAETQAEVEQLQIDNQRLTSRANREWFIIGAMVLIVGMLIGLIVPRIRWRKKSSWGDL